jgi:hypothetical protein
MDPMSTDWPIAELDPVRRLRVLAAGISGADVTERVIAASLPKVWQTLTDFEGDFTRIVSDMHAVQIESHTSGRVTLKARSRFGFRARLDGPVDTGWCWLQSRFLVIGVAAVAEGATHTRVAFTGGVRVPHRPAVIPIGVRREARRTLDRLEQVVSQPRPEEKA